MNTRLISSLAAVSLIALGTAACSGKSDDTAGTMSGSATDTAMMPPTDTMMPGDGAMASGAAMASDSHAANFVIDGMKGDNAEVKMGQLAVDQGSSAAVKAFGRMLVTDHGAHLGKLASLGSTMGVSKTDAIKPEADAAYAKLKGMNGAAFDKGFAMHMVEDHNKDIAKYQAEADGNDPAALKDLARQTLPTLKKHLAAAKALPM